MKYFLVKLIKKQQCVIFGKAGQQSSTLKINCITTFPFSKHFYGSYYGVSNKLDWLRCKTILYIFFLQKQFS